MGMIIGLNDFAARRSAATPDAVPPQASEFTRRDRMDLAAWAGAERRVVFCPSDLGTFAMLHFGQQPWASWGVMRQGRSVLMWNCVSLADIARAATMTETLAVIAHVAALPPLQNVVSFASALRSARSDPAS